MPPSRIVDQLAAAISEFRPRFTGEAGDELGDVLSRLRGPVRVAVVGRVKAGKSTLVNALLGHPVAPTDVSECTKVVTWFHYGHPERVDLLLTDGSTVPRQLDEKGRLPTELGVPLEQVAALHVYLANDALKDLTLIDTPGIASVNEAYSAATDRLLSASAGRRSTPERADAVVFLMNQVVMAEEMQALEALRSASDGADSALSTVGVLSKADKLGDGEEDPWPVAVALADTYSGRFREKVSSVVPVIGLLAATAETAALTERDAKAVSTLARMDPARFERMLWSAERFVESECEVDRPDRERLLELLDLYGVRRAVALASEGVVGATALRRELSRVSGISEIKGLLGDYFGRKDHLLKARSALATAQRVSYWTADACDPLAPAELRTRLEHLRLDPVMHPLNELEVWQDGRAGRLRLEDDLQAELDRLFDQGTPAQRVGVEEGDDESVARAAVGAIRRWRTFLATRADPAQAGAARVAIRSYELIWSAATENSSSTG